MAELTPTALEKILRKKYVDVVSEMLKNAGEEVLAISGNVIAFPTVNEACEDAWIEITVKVPKGEKLEVGYAGYDGYEQAEAYKKAQAEIAEKEAKAKAKKLAALEKKAKKSKEKEKGE